MTDSLQSLLRDMNAVARPSSYEHNEFRNRLLRLSPVGSSSGTPVASSNVPEDDTLSKLLADVENRAQMFGPSSWAAELCDRLRALLNDCATEPENDVITGDEVDDLPDGSLVVVCYRDGKPKVSAGVRLRGDGHFATGLSYRVLYRAPEAEIKVGDKVSGKRADTLPNDSVVQRHEGTYPLIKAVPGWRMGPGDAPFVSLVREYGSSATFRVLSIGGK